MITYRHIQIWLSLIMTGIVLSLTGLCLYAGALSMIGPGIAAICMIWAANYLLDARPKFKALTVGLVFIAYTTFFVCFTGGIFSPGLYLFIFCLSAGIFMEDRSDLFICFFIIASLVVFFYFGPSWGPGLLNLNEYRMIYLAVLFAGLGSVFILLHNKQQALAKTLRRQAKEMNMIRQESEKVMEEAKNAIEVKDRFLANMSHEIRNPMNGVLGMIHVLLDSDLDAEQRRHADIAYNSAKALLTIVNDILDLSKIEAGKIELDIRPFDLDIAVKDIVSLPELQARQKGLDFYYNIDTDVPRLLKGDIGRIRQVILNFTGNAIKFTESGSVSLNVTLKDDTDDQALVHFSVDDTGIGIGEEVLKGLFTPFVQADSSITKRFGGTGLGLSICKMFIEMMGGQVGADSIEMIGSTFWFEVPFKKQPPEEVALDLSSIPLDQIRVAAVSDGPEPSSRLIKALDRIKASYETCVHDKITDLVLFAKDTATPFHVVIMEVSESDRYARALGKTFSEHAELKEIRRMIVTAIGKKGDAREFEDLGFSAFLSYPLDGTILQDAIRLVLSSPNQAANRAIITRYALAEREKQAFKILIVDDIETNVLTAQALIRKQGYQTDAASNGEMALEKVKNNRYDLILMDCQMPVMDGYETSRRIREFEQTEQRIATPIIAMTGNAFEKDRQTCINAGMNDFLSKPVNPQALVAIIEEFKAGRQDAGNLTQESNDIPVSDTEPAPEKSALLGADSVSLPRALAVFDQAGLFERFGNDEELADDVLESFFQEAEELVDNLLAAILDDNPDPETVRACAHALKGAAANVNAEQLSHAAFEIETMAGDDQLPDALVVPDLIKGHLNRFIQEAQI